MSPVVFEVLARVSSRDRIAFEKLTQDMNDAVSRLGRARSVSVEEVEAQSPDVAARKISVSFDTDGDLAAWLASPEHASFVGQLQSMLVGRYETSVRSGLEAWVPTPGVRPPKRWKSAATTFVGLFPVLIVLRFVSDRLHLDALGPIPALALSVAITCIAMTWLVMPALTARLGAWLYA